MPVSLVDSEGTLEIDGDTLMYLLVDTFKLGVTSATSNVSIYHNDTELHAAINSVIAKTIDNPKWQRRFERRLFREARAYQRSKTEEDQ